MDWVSLIEAILKILEGCKEEQSEESVFKTMRQGGMRCSLALRRAGRDNGLRGAELRLFVDSAMDDLQNASDDEIRQFIADAGQ